MKRHTTCTCDSNSLPGPRAEIGIAVSHSPGPKCVFHRLGGTHTLSLISLSHIQYPSRCADSGGAAPRLGRPYPSFQSRIPYPPRSDADGAAPRYPLDDEAPVERGGDRYREGGPPRLLDRKSSVPCLGLAQGEPPRRPSPGLWRPRPLPCSKARW